jgi:hypothetical protein
VKRATPSVELSDANQPKLHVPGKRRNRTGPQEYLLARTAVCLIFSAMDREGIAMRFRTFAMSEGIDCNDPLLTEAVEALRKLERARLEQLKLI